MHVQAPRVVALRDPAQLLTQALVVLGVDDVLLEIAGPGMGAHRGEATQPSAAANRRLRCSRWASAASAGSLRARSDLDLGVDQLAARRGRQQLVGAALLHQGLEAVLELERRRVHDRELLLQPDGEVVGLLEGLADPVHVEPVVAELVRRRHQVR